MYRPSCRTFQRKHLRVGSRPWVGVAELLHHRSDTHVLVQLPVHVLVALAVGFFLLQVAQLLTGPITPELCFLSVAFQCLVLGMLRCVWCMGSLETQPDAFPEFEVIFQSVFQFQL